MPATKSCTTMREHVNSLSSTFAKYLVRQGFSNHTAAFTSNVIIFLLTINIPLAVVALALFTSILTLFACGAVAVISAALLSLAITLVLGFFFLSLVMSFAFAVTLFVTLSTIAACSFALTFALVIALVGTKVAKRLKTVGEHVTNNAQGPMQVSAEPGSVNPPTEPNPAPSPAKKIPNSNRDEQEHSTITSDYSGSG